MKLVENLSTKTISKKKKWGVLLLGMGGYILLYNLGEYLLGIDFREVTEEYSLFWWLVIVTSSFVATIVAHEGLHGLFFWLFTGKAKFGFKLWSSWGPIFWASSPGSLISRRRFQIVALAPQILTIILLPIMVFVPLSSILAYCLLIAAGFNLCGGCFDIYLFFVLRKYPKHFLVQDTLDGALIWEEDN